MKDFDGNGASVDALLQSIKNVEPLITNAAEAIDRDRMVHPQIIDALRKCGVFRMYWPREEGGFELDPLNQIRLYEEISRIDASVGWVATFGGLTGSIASHLQAGARKTLLPSPDMVVAGQYAPVGRADRLDGGYKVSGRWSFGSGCRHADAMMAGVTIFEGDRPKLDPNGQPVTRMVVFPASQCNILLNTWDTVGLRGTGSHDYEVENLFVPDEHTFSYFEPAYFEGPLYRFGPLFLFSHAPMALGLARGAIDTLVQIASEKRLAPSGRYLREEAHTQEVIARAEALYASARSFVFSSLGDLWEALVSNETPSMRDRALFRLSLVNVTRAAKEVVSLAFDAAATSAVQRNNPLDRRMRDVLTLCQHRVVQNRMYRPLGQVLLGLESADPYI